MEQTERLDGVRKQLEGLRQALSFQRGMLGTYQQELRVAIDPKHAQIIREMRIPLVEEDIKRLEGEITALLGELPRIRQQEAEVTRALIAGGALDVVPDEVAEVAVAEIKAAVGDARTATADGRPEKMTRLLEEILEKLNGPGKSAAAKLKVPLPIVPAIVSYELEMDTEAFVSKAWRRIKSLFGGGQ